MAVALRAERPRPPMVPATVVACFPSTAILDEGFAAALVHHEQVGERSADVDAEPIPLVVQDVAQWPPYLTVWRMTNVRVSRTPGRLPTQSVRNSRNACCEAKTPSA